MIAARTLYDKVWDSYIVDDQGDGFALLYVDRHLVDEHSSAQAFDALRAAGRAVRTPRATLAVADHSVPTTRGVSGIRDLGSGILIDTLERNVVEFGVPYLPLDDARHGISHVVGPEQGFTLPGMLIVCGDSHAATHGAFGAFAFGIGTTEVAHVLANQTILAKRSRNMRIVLDGELPFGAAAKDLILSLIGTIGSAGALGHVVEYAGPTIAGLGMEARMTICNMSVEMGALAGLIAPDGTTFAYLRDRPHAPSSDFWEKAVGFWETLRTDPAARFDREVSFDVARVSPQVTWGTSPEDVVPVTGRVPAPADEPNLARREAMVRSLDYMDLSPGTPMIGVRIDKVFIGSCTNGRLDDLHAAAAVVKGRKLAAHVQGLVVPGSNLVKAQAEREGLDRVFIEAGFEWRHAGCSMCLAMNGDRLQRGERCASTSNRNFEGRQGAGGRTHLMSPAMAAAAAVAGCIADVRDFFR